MGAETPTSNTIENSTAVINERSIVWCNDCKITLRNLIDTEDVVQLE